MEFPNHVRRGAIRAQSTILVAVGLFAAGPCGAAGTADRPASPVRAEAPARPKLEIGMSAEQVVAIVGKPHRIKTAPNEAGLKAEIWYYEYKVKSGVHEEVLSMRDVPYTNPKTGVEMTLKEPVYTMVDDYMTETTALVMVDDHLTGSKRYRSVSQEY